MAEDHVGRTVVVGIDGSEDALRAVRWAAAKAARRHLPLRVVMAFEWAQEHGIGWIGLGERYCDIMRRQARYQVAEARMLAEQHSPGLDVQGELVDGFPVSVLRAESRRAVLVVLGDRGYGGISGLLVGSVSVAMAAQAECPVILVRGDGQAAGSTAREPVVVGVDGSPTSDAALAFAFEAAAGRNVPLVAVHTWWDVLVDPMMASLLDWDAIEADEREVLAERLAGWDAKYPDVRVQRLVVRERAARRLVEESRRAQLVVVGSRGRGAAAGLLLGSVSHAVLYRAHCSVAVVRPNTWDET